MQERIHVKFFRGEQRERIPIAFQPETEGLAENGGVDGGSNQKNLPVDDFEQQRGAKTGNGPIPMLNGNRVFVGLLEADSVSHPQHTSDIAVLIWIQGLSIIQKCSDGRFFVVVFFFRSRPEILEEVGLNMLSAYSGFHPGVKILDDLERIVFNSAIAAVAHKKFESLDVPTLLKDKHVIFDVKCTLPREIIDARL